MRLVGFDAEPLAALFFVGLEVSFADVDVAVPLKSNDVRRDAVQEPSIVADYDNTTREVYDGFFECT